MTEDEYKRDWAPVARDEVWIKAFRSGSWLIQDITGWNFSEIAAAVSENGIQDAYIDYDGCGSHRVVMIWEATDGN